MTGPLAPSQALLDQGLGAHTTASAVSRVLKRGRFELSVWAAQGGPVRVVAISPERAVEALDFLVAKGYAAEPHPHQSRQVLVHGKRRTTRTHLDPATYVTYERHTP